MSGRNNTKKAKMTTSIPVGEFVPRRAVPFDDTRAKLNAYLASKGDVGGWKRRRNFPQA